MSTVAEQTFNDVANVANDTFNDGGMNDFDMYEPVAVPFYRRRWFIVAVLAVLLIIAFFVYRSRNTKKQEPAKTA